MLLIDIEAKDVASERTASTDAIRAAPPEGYASAFEHLDRAIEYGLEVEGVCEEALCADDVAVVYTGQSTCACWTAIPSAATTSTAVR